MESFCGGAGTAGAGGVQGLVDTACNQRQRSDQHLREKKAVFMESFPGELVWLTGHDSKLIYRSYR